MGEFDSYKPGLAMVGLQFCFAGIAVFSRAAFLQGMSPRVFVVYRQGMATLVMAPLAYLSRRKNPCRPSLGSRGFAWLFLASVVGVTATQNFYFEGIHLASSTAASALTNLIPAITFVMATISGLEKVNIRSLRSIAKILGTVFCASGAVSMALLKGPKLLNLESIPLKSIFSPGHDEWLLGCLLLFGSCCCWSLWMIFQVPISASCPDHLLTSSWMCFLSTLESVTVALVVEEDIAAWKVNSFLQISCCLYSGIGLAVSFFVQAWCISKRGPLFAAMFNPVCTVIVAIFSAILLHEGTYIGSLIGAFVVILGLYIVLWGKAKDMEEMEKKTHSLQRQTDQSITVQVLIDEFCKEGGKPDLKERLLSQE